MKKQSKSAKIVAYKKANPNASYEEIAKAAGCDRSFVGVALSKAGLTKKRNPTKGQQVLRDHIRKEAQRTDVPNVHALSVEIFTLRQQIAGYIAVISYLESKLGLEENGTPV